MKPQNCYKSRLKISRKSPRNEQAIAVCVPKVIPNRAADFWSMPMRLLDRSGNHGVLHFVADRDGDLLRDRRASPIVEVPRRVSFNSTGVRPLAAGAA